MVPHSSLFLCFVLFAVSATPARAGDYTAVVDPGHRHQTFEGWGVSLCWSGKVVGAFPEATREEYADLIFHPTKGLGLNVLRYNIGGGENPQLRPLGFREGIAGFQPRPGEWDWDADPGQRFLLQAAKARGANIFEAFANSPPWWMTVSGSVTGARDQNANNLAPEHEADFANYLAEVVAHFHQFWGVTFRTLDPLNEPDTHWWNFGGKQEGCRFDPAAQARILQATARALEARRLPTRLSASDENSIDTAVHTFKSFDPATRGLIWQLNTHSYAGSRRGELARLAAEGPRRNLWMSEYGDGDRSGMTLAGRILDDLNGLHPAAWVYWQALDNPAWGLIANREDGRDASYRLMPKYWVLAQFSRYIRPGSVFVDVDDHRSVAALDPSGRSLVLVTVNRDEEDRVVTYDLSRFQAAAGGVVRAAALRSSATENVAALPVLTATDGRLVATLPRRSVTTFVVTGLVP